MQSYQPPGSSTPLPFVAGADSVEYLQAKQSVRYLYQHHGHEYIPVNHDMNTGDSRRVYCGYAGLDGPSAEFCQGPRGSVVVFFQKVLRCCAATADRIMSAAKKHIADAE